MSNKASKCPVCGSSGEDLVFKFYCFNPFCQNAHIDQSRSQEIKNEIENLILHMWQLYSVGETLEEFRNHFFSCGGCISFDHRDKKLMHPRVVEPEWLLDRRHSLIC
jgi:hypothetical protein